MPHHPTVEMREYISKNKKSWAVLEQKRVDDSLAKTTFVCIVPLRTARASKKYCLPIIYMNNILKRSKWKNNQSTTL